ncbi:lysophospholipid acyltransferase family protein [uncultured Cohaesibacter sp.]|uniref:lysophospholipid acyltransferase family protein n=1 Tax=uncultured Cohaesibacter sp. TaxID=1002546 RepID=UPI00292D28D8|nr:lysophospholipid acyltransferase family protein [uncultured Cohaesibacter sp.]
MQLFRSVLFIIAFYFVTTLTLIVTLFTMPLPRRFIIVIAKHWGTICSHLYTIIMGGSFEIRGREHLRSHENCILAAKHMSAFETFALLPVVDDPLFIFKRELLHIPLFGWGLAKAGMIPVDRNSGLAALKSMQKKTKEKMTQDTRQLIIFPEGTRRPVGAPPDYKSGVSLLYKGLNVRCYPVALNTGLFWPKDSPIRRSGKIIIEILPPIEPGLPMDKFFEQLSNTIESQSNRLISEAQRAVGSQEAS